jgi:hypothetical protein
MNEHRTVVKEFPLPLLIPRTQLEDRSEIVLSSRNKCQAGYAQSPYSFRGGPHDGYLPYAGIMFDAAGTFTAPSLEQLGTASELSSN